MAGLGDRLDRGKEKLLFAAVLAVTALVAYETFAPLPPEPDYPDQPRVKKPEPAGAVLGAAKLYAASEGDAYFDPRARYVFVEPPKVRIFDPVDLEVPTVKPPKLVMPLPDPGPFLEHSGSLPRLDGSPPPAPKAPAELPPAPGPAPGGAEGGGDG